VPESALLTFAVVIPALNEANGLPLALTSLQQQRVRPDRVIVVDGGSQDRTAEIAQEYGATVLVSAARGRGNQTATGINAATEDVIVVGHADMVFPPDALVRIRCHLLSHPRCPGGCLGHRFATTRWPYRLIEWFDHRRAAAGQSYGDQCQFFRRELLTTADGFPAQPILEDVELAARLRSLGRPAYLNCPVTVSPRRFERLGLVRTLWQNWQFRRAYRRGGVAATQAIFDRYYPPRKDSS
jgi:rSAM/selenodomain-associated transferase 2